MVYCLDKVVGAAQDDQSVARYVRLRCISYPFLGDEELGSFYYNAATVPYCSADSLKLRLGFAR